MADLPSDAAIRSKMQVLMKTVDLETMSTKQFIGALSTAFGGVNLTSKKKHIKQWITEIIDGMEGNDAEENEEEEDEEDEEEEEEEDEEKPKKRQGGLQSAREISDELASFLNCDKYMARTAIVKALWGYIKDKNLQNPDNKKEILLDAPMKAVFGTDRFDMFSMNKYVSTHIHPFPPLDLTPSTKRKSPGDIEPKAKKKKREGVKRAPGIQAPYRLSKDLAAVCGKDILPRPQVTSALWAYIRRCNLQVSVVCVCFIGWMSS